MIAWRLRRIENGPLRATYRAIAYGLMPVVALLLCFETLVPTNLLADNLGTIIPSGHVDLNRYVLFVAVAAIHVLICVLIVTMSWRSILSRISHNQVWRIAIEGILMPTLFLITVFLSLCHLNIKLYVLSYARVIRMLSFNPDFRYQYEPCENASLLRLLCADGNLHLSVFAFVLIVAGLIATITVCADIGVSSYAHSKILTPKRLSVAGTEMHDDINRYAASLLLALTSSSVAISIFQPLGITLLAGGSAESTLYANAALAASLFWPLTFGAIFIGIFTIPGLLIVEKRQQALRLFDANEISKEDYESFFAVRDAFPQSLRWMLLSGLPLVMSFAPRLVDLAN